MRKPDDIAPDQEFVATKGGAKILKVKEQTLAKWRSEGRGPPWFRLGPGGRNIRYKTRDLLAYLEEVEQA